MACTKKTDLVAGSLDGLLLLLEDGLLDALLLGEGDEGLGLLANNEDVLDLGAEGLTTGVLEGDHIDGTVVVVVGHRPPAASPGPLVVLPDPQTAAIQLYSTLREHDGDATSRILVVMPPDEPIWEAIADRLRRATTPG